MLCAQCMAAQQPLRFLQAERHNALMAWRGLALGQSSCCCCVVPDCMVDADVDSNCRHSAALSYLAAERREACTRARICLWLEAVRPAL